MRSLLDYTTRLEVTQGESLDEPFPLFPWERRFIKGAFSTRGHAAPRTARGKIPGSHIIARQPSGTET